MEYTLGGAARATGVAKSTLSKALKNGRLSYVEKSSAGYKIDAAELFRVFPKNTGELVQSNDREQVSETGMNRIEREAYETQIKLLREMLDKADANAERWAMQAERLALKDQSTRKPWWRRLIG